MADPNKRISMLQLSALGAAIVAFILSAIACESTFSKSPERAREAAAAVTYTRDSRTGLCFAMVGFLTYGGYSGTSIATVPCEKVPASLLR